VADIRAYVTKSLMDVRSLMNQDVAVAKQWLNEHIDAITMTPTVSPDGKRYYTASGRWNLLGGTEFGNAGGCGGWI